MDSSKQGMPPPDPYAEQGGYQQGYPPQPPPAYSTQPGCKYFATSAFKHFIVTSQITIGIFN